MIKIGIVGANRGADLISSFKCIEGVKIEALCDINEDVLMEKAKKHAIPKAFVAYEKMLECDIDAVVVAAPMQLHVAQAIAAVQAGKHVLSEVTAAVSMEELWWLLEEVERSGKIYMFAENYCYIPEVQVISQMVKKGLFGEVFYGEGEYIHELKKMTLNANGSVSWRSYWQLGRRGNFYPTHSLGPVMQWFGRERIKSVICQGCGWHTAPELRQEDTSITLCKTESGKLIRLRTDCLSLRPHNLAYYSLQGTKGAYEAPRGMGDDHKIWLAGMDNSTDEAIWRPLKHFYQEYLPKRYLNATEEQKATGHWGGDFFMADDFIRVIREGKKPPIDIYDACEWTAVALLSELSATNDGRSFDMPDFRGWQQKQNQITRV